MFKKRYIKPITVSLFILMLCSVFFLPPAFAGEEKHATILFTGATRGNLDPIHTWGNNFAGGLARRAQAIASIRGEGLPVLLLDCGEAFSERSKELDIRQDTSEFMLKAMTSMKYDALNFGVLELQFGPEILEKNQSAISFPFIASNLKYNGSSPSWAREYLIKKIGGIKMAVLGIVDPDKLPDFLTQEQKKQLQATPPAEALNRLMPEVRKQADLVILLSQLSTSEMLALFKSVKGVDVSITAGCREFLGKNAESDKMHSSGCGSNHSDDNITEDEAVSEGPILLYSGPKGMALGRLTIMLDSNGKMLISKSKPITLDRSFVDEPEMAALTETFKKTMEIKEAEIKQKLQKDLQMSPEEFMKQYQNQHNQ